MNLLERVSGAIALARKAETAVQRRTEAEKVDDIAMRVRELRVPLQLATERRAAFRDFTAGVEKWPDPSIAALTVERFRATLSSSAAGEPQEMRKMVAALQGFSTKAADRISVCLTDSRKSLDLAVRPVVDLVAVGGVEAEVAALKRRVDSLLSRDWTKASTLELRTILKERAALTRDLDRLGLKNVPEAVKKFYAAAGAAGAPLELLTSDVLAWIDDKGQRSRIRVVVR